MYARQVNQQMRQRVGHKALVASRLYLSEYLSVAAHILLRAPYPKGDIKLGMRQARVDGGRVHTAIEVQVALITLFTMVGHINHDSLFLFVATYDFVYHRVVIQHRIVIVGQHRALMIAQVGLQFAILVARKAAVLAWCALTIVYVLPHEVEDGEVVVAILGLQAFIVGQQFFVVGVQLVVARVKLCLAQRGVV